MTAPYTPRDELFLWCLAEQIDRPYLRAERQSLR